MLWSIAMIEVDDNVPVPTRPARVQKYPIPTLQVGQSFFVKGGKLKSIRSQLWAWRRRLPDRMFICRQVEGGVRVWRTV
jgi:hypothetical protein